MNKRILIVCIFAAVLIILASLTPVVGYYTKSINKKNIPDSPLFTLRTQSSISYENVKIVNANYLGKDNTLNLFPIKKTYIQDLVDKTIKLFDKNPKILSIITDRLTKLPEIRTFLNDKSMTLDEFKSQILCLLKNPDLLRDKVNKASLPKENEPMPQGLSTYNALGCFIAFLILVPIFAMVGLIIATITIITCLLPQCRENAIRSLVEGFVQGLTLPQIS